jgi:hypothetical protein
VRQRCAGAHFFAAKGKFPPLDCIPAHHRNNVRSTRRAGLGNMIGMTGVEGIVFGDDSSDKHGGVPFLVNSWVEIFLL